MDGTRLQSLIYSGYAKEAAKIGFPYDIYRPLSPMAPIGAWSYVTTLPCAFIADAKATVAEKWQTPTWILRADGSQLQQFDFLVGPFGTFYVADMQPQLPMEAIRCNGTITLSRVQYVNDPDTGIISSVPIPYAQGLPFFNQFRREEIKATTSNTTIGEAITQWLAFIPLPNGTIKQDDSVTDDRGVNYVVDAPDFNNIGYAARIRLATL